MNTIPRVMSTQHPDNARKPYFIPGDMIGGEDEILEAYLQFSQYGCQEQMWDFEGKRAVSWVVSELYAKDLEFFRKKPLGRDVFLTFRIPNPEIETIVAKLVPEILASIPRVFDAARTIYQVDVPPVFEVILPMTKSVEQLNRIYYYYQNFIIKGKDSLVFEGDNMSVRQWLGEFKPEKINVIPLFEDYDSLINADKIVAGYIEGKGLQYQRVFLARSDPALNYGALAAVLLLNIALQRLDALEKRAGIPIYPILGVGCSPFRGNFKPVNVKSNLTGYQSCQTFTIQSAFKYDWPAETVIEAIKEITSASRGRPMPVDEEQTRLIIDKSISAYQEQIPEIASLVHRITPFIPQRRLRKLHIGLFGYARDTAGVHLPRAISFCAGLYSLGLPPEVLGLHTLTDKDRDAIWKLYPGPHFEEDLKDSLTFYNPECLSLLTKDMQMKISRTLEMVDYKINEDHREVTSQIIKCLQKNETESIYELVLRAARIRRFLG